jgi:peptidoglycan/LPS O-acetylase OafA/YrhL
LRGGWSLRGFASHRLKRLLPLYGLGLLLGVGESALVGGPAPAIWTAAIFGALLIPAYAASADTYAYPLNSVSWSLSCEIAINLAYAALARVLSTRVLAAVVAGGAALTAWLFVTTHDGGGGFTVGSLPTGYARTLFGFPLGVLLHRLYVAGRLKRLKGVRPSILIIAFVALCLLPRNAATDGALSSILVLGLVPLIVACAGKRRFPPGTAPPTPSSRGCPIRSMRRTFRSSP